MNIQKSKILLVVFLFISMVAGIFGGNLPAVQALQSNSDWTVPVNLSHSGSSTNPLLVVDADGLIHVIWVDQFDGYKYIDSADGITWTSPRTVKFPFSPDQDSLPTFIADGNGITHIFWLNNINTLYYSQVRSGSLGNPTVWNQARPLSGSVVDFKAAIDSRNTLHVSYGKNFSKGDDVAGIFYRKLDAIGWSAPVNLFASEYFRSISPEGAHVRIAVSNDPVKKDVYVVWDNPAQKRIFMAKSVDDGLNWDDAYEVVGPEADLGSGGPHNVEINIFKDGILLMWVVGSPGDQCTLYSRWSISGDDELSEPRKMFDGLSICPNTSDFIGSDQDYSLAVLSVQNGLSMVAWNGKEWSSPQPQSELASFSDPATLDPILFSCQEIAFHNNSFFVVGCDKGNSGDIWFTSRSLGSFESWFPSPSAWSLFSVVANIPQKISDVVSVSDESNRIHTIWAQSAVSEKNIDKPSIQYIRWDGAKWSEPVSIITDLTGVPTQLTLTIDKQGKLLLTWVDQSNGELMFSWANSERANIPVEWSQSKALPAPSKLVSSPNILVDSAGTIVVAYAVYVNEHRGIYITYSTDLGANWSSPSLAYDASSAGWDMVDQPKISLTTDGTLHLLFRQYSLFVSGYVPISLHYSRSSDSGITWDRDEVVDEGNVQWSEIINDGQSLHRLWQVKDEAAVALHHQFSTDEGVAWGAKTTISKAPEKAIQVSTTMSTNGNLYFTQMIDNEILSIQDWKWDNLLWDAQETQTVNNLDYTALFAASSVITSDGQLSVFFVVENKNFNYSLINAKRALDSLDLSRVFPPVVLSTITPLILPTATPDINLTPITTASPLTGLNDTPSFSMRNIVGVSLVVIVVLVIALTVLRKKATYD